MSMKRFRVAFSFAGEKREFVAALASLLAEEFGRKRILYDKFHEAEFARRDLGIYLPELYHKESDLVVIVVSPSYDQKQWTGLEWTAIHDLLSQRRHDEVMLCRFDHATATGLYSTAGFVELDGRKPEDIRDLILERLESIDERCKNGEAAIVSSADRPAKTSTPNNLPRLQPFFGRAAELATIREALDPDSRTWGALIDGPGGMGKTSLAVRAAYDCPPGLFQRIVFVSVKDREMDDDGERPLGNLLVPGFLEMLNELARELGQPDIAKSPEDQRIRLLLDALRPAQALLILDNLESLPKSDRDQIFTFVKRLPPGCKAILTSRRRIGSGSDEIILEKLDQDAALATLADLARRNPLLARTSEAERIALYTQTTGKPLLLRWVAGQLGRGSCRTFTDALAFLRTCPPDNDPLEFIFGDLAKEFTSDEEKVLCALTHFSLPAKMKHIAEVAALEDPHAETSLRALANRSLVIPDQEEREFALVPMVAEFLRNHRPEIVTESGDRLAQCALALVLENGFREYDRFPVLEANWQTIAPALPLFASGQNETLQTVCTALDDFLDFTGRWDEWLSLSQLGEASALASGDYLAAAARAYFAGWVFCLREQALEVFEHAKRVEQHLRVAGSSPQSRARAIRLMGHGHSLKKDHKAAITSYSQGVELLRRYSPKSDDFAGALNELAGAYRLSGDLEAAERNYLKAARVARAVNYTEGIAYIAGNLAMLALDRGDWKKAEQLARKALDLSTKLGRKGLIAADSERLAQALAQQGKTAEAIPLFNRTVEIFTHLRSPELKRALANLRAVYAQANGKGN